MNSTYVLACFEQAERQTRLRDAARAAAKQVTASADFAELEALAVQFPSIAEHVAFIRRVAS